MRLMFVGNIPPGEHFFFWSWSALTDLGTWAWYFASQRKYGSE